MSSSNTPLPFTFMSVQGGERLIRVLSISEDTDVIIGEYLNSKGEEVIEKFQGNQVYPRYDAYVEFKEIMKRISTRNSSHIADKLIQELQERLK